jgi:hypothetical protein
MNLLVREPDATGHFPDGAQARGGLLPIVGDASSGQRRGDTGARSFHIQVHGEGGL